MKYGFRMSSDLNAALSLTSSQRRKWPVFLFLLKTVLRKLTDRQNLYQLALIPILHKMLLKAEITGS